MGRGGGRPVCSLRSIVYSQHTVVIRKKEEECRRCVSYIFIIIAVSVYERGGWCRVIMFGCCGGLLVVSCAGWEI